MSPPEYSVSCLLLLLTTIRGSTRGNFSGTRFTEFPSRCWRESARSTRVSADEPFRNVIANKTQTPAPMASKLAACDFKQRLQSICESLIHQRNDFFCESFHFFNHRAHLHQEDFHARVSKLDHALGDLFRRPGQAGSQTPIR